MPELPLTEPTETALEEPEGSLAALHEASGRAELVEVAQRWPACLAAWAALGNDASSSGRHVEAYAFFRVGYHRGLDRARAAGWRGGGLIPWRREGNRGFLDSLAGLGRAADGLREDDEAARCRDFLARLAPDAPGP